MYTLTGIQKKIQLIRSWYVISINKFSKKDLKSKSIGGKKCPKTVS